jgi:hypothetical protein
LRNFSIFDEFFRCFNKHNFIEKSGTWEYSPQLFQIPKNLCNPGANCAPQKMESIRIFSSYFSRYAQLPPPSPGVKFDTRLINMQFFGTK